MVSSIFASHFNGLPSPKTFPTVHKAGASMQNQPISACIHLSLVVNGWEALDKHADLKSLGIFSVVVNTWSNYCIFSPSACVHVGRCFYLIIILIRNKKRMVNMAKQYALKLLDICCWSSFKTAADVWTSFVTVNF